MSVHPEDNIAEHIDEIVRGEPEVQIQPEKPLTEFNLVQACQAISRHYKRAFKALDFVSPHQFTDGSVAEFVDQEKNELVATARLRHRNQMTVDKVTGNMSIQTYMTDLSFKRDTLTITIGKST
jgi:hypothetical protein